MTSVRRNLGAKYVSHITSTSFLKKGSDLPFFPPLTPDNLANHTLSVVPREDAGSRGWSGAHDDVERISRLLHSVVGQRLLRVLPSFLF